MRKNATKIAALMLSLALTVTSVNIPTTSSAASKVTLNKSKATLYLGGASSKKTTTLKAKFNGKSVKATFTSNKPKVAKVAKSTGKVTAVKAGTATITAKYKSKKATAKITVKQYVTGITAPASVEVTEGQAIDISGQVSVKPASASNKAVKFTSQDSLTAAVNNDGTKLKGVKEGTTNITVKAKDGSNKTATIAVTVKAAPVEPTKEPDATKEPEATPTVDPTGLKDWKATSSKTLSITLNDGTVGTVPLENELSRGDNVISFQFNGKTYTNVLVTWKEQSGVDISIIKAEARAVNQVTVTLENAPLSELKADDFSITPALKVVSVTTNNNIVSLTTENQAKGTEYKITPATGNGFATFKASEIDVTEGVIASTKTDNNRQLRITFTEALQKSSVTLDNTYINMMDENEKVHYSSVPDAEEKNLRKLLGANAANWEIVPATPNSDSDTEYIVRAISGAAPLDSKTGAAKNVTLDTLGLKYDENSTVEVRDAKNAAGYVSTSQGTLTWTDDVTPTMDINPRVTHATGVKPYLFVSFSEPIRTFDANKEMRVYIDGIPIDDGIIHGVKADGTVDTTTTDIVATGTVSQNSCFALDLSSYKEGETHQLKIVGAQDLKGNVQELNPWCKDFTIETSNVAPTPITYVKPAITDIYQRADNVLQVFFDRFVNPLAWADSQSPAVTIENCIFNNDAADHWDDLYIIWDGTQYKYWTEADKRDNSGVLPTSAVSATPADGTTSYTTIGGKSLGFSLVGVEQKKGGNDGKGNPIYSALTIVLNATIDAQDEKFSYDDSKEVYRTVTVNNFYPENATTLGLAGQKAYLNDTYTKKMVLVHDIDAPKPLNTWYDVNAGKLYVGWTDAPFNGKISLATRGEVRISMTTDKSKTASYVAELSDPTDRRYITVPNSDLMNGTALVFEANKYVEIDLQSLKNLGYQKTDDLLTDDASGNKLFNSAVYTVSFAKETVLDVDGLSNITYKVGSLHDLIVNAYAPGPGYNACVATAASITTPAAGTASAALNGGVPQALPSTIISGQDILDAADCSFGDTSAIVKAAIDAKAIVGGELEDSIFAGLAASTNASDENIVGSLAYMIKHPNAILVVFDTNENGHEVNVLEISANNKANYTFNGVALSPESHVEYYENDIIANSGKLANLSKLETDANNGYLKEGYAVVTLADGDVDKTGRYIFSVANITNVAGKKMLPVKDSLSLTDNTAPRANSYEFFGSKEIDITFDEEVELPSAVGNNADTTHAVNNFTVTVNNNVYNVESVTKVAKNVLRIRVSKDFVTTNGVAVVSLAKDNNGHMYVTDGSSLKNEAAIVNSIKKK